MARKLKKTTGKKSRKPAAGSKLIAGKKKTSARKSVNHQSSIINNKSDDVLETAKAAAEYASVSVRTIGRWVLAGLPMVKGKHSKSCIDSFVERRDQEKKNKAEEKKQAKKAKSGKKETKEESPADSEKPSEYTGIFLTFAEREALAAADADEDMFDISEGEKARRRMGKKRKAERDVHIPPVVNWERRKYALTGWEPFCDTYFSKIFYLPYSDNQREIAGALVETIMTGSNQAIATERGGGKSSFTKIIAGVYAPLKGLVKYIPIIRANHDDAIKTLIDIKSAYMYNDLLNEDFPEVCALVRALCGSPQKAMAMTTNGGQPTKLTWSGNIIILPEVFDKYGNPSPASGCIIVTIGIDGKIRGLAKEHLRPDLLLIDDLETRETVRSPMQQSVLKEKIDSDIGALSAPDKPMPVVMTGTIIKAGCLIDVYTDRKQEPSYFGIRHRRIIEWPVNAEMWQRYMQMRKQDQRNGNRYAAAATQYYIDNRQVMDEGASLSNKYALKPKAHDGTVLEISALQSCYNFICDKGLKSFNTEYQNDPGQDDNEGIEIEVDDVQKKLSRVERRIVPGGCKRITMAIDIRRREFHWSVVAWKEGAIGYVIDYGQGVINSPSGKLIEASVQLAQEKAILKAMLEFKNLMDTPVEYIDNETGEIGRQARYIDQETGEGRKIDLVGVDAGWMPDALHTFCRTTGGRYKPVRGLGTNQFAGKNYKKPKKTKLPSGMHWHAETRPQSRQVYYALDVDNLKQKVHEGFLIPDDQNGALWLFGDDPIEHCNFSDQILAEVWVREFVEGKGWIERWKVLYDRNHWLDTMAYNVALAEMLGITVLGLRVVRAQKRVVSTNQNINGIRTTY